MASADHTTTSSLPRIDHLYPSTQRGNIDELQDVDLVEDQQQTTVTTVKTPFGLVPSRQWSIFTTQSSISKRSQAVKRSLNLSSEMTTSEKKKKVSMTVLLTNLCCEHQLTSTKEFNDAIHTNIEIRNFKRLYGGSLNFQKALIAACETAYGELPILSFQERVEAVDDGYGEEFEQAVKEWKLFIQQTIGNEKFYNFFKIMNMQMDKVKTIYLVGAASGGKSAIIYLLTSVYRFSEIGKAGAQAINSNFWLEDLVDKRVAVLDEILATQANIDSLKMLMEGNFFTHTNVKFGKSYQIDPMPVLIACNQSVTRLVQGHTDAINKRCIRVEFYMETKRKLHYDRKLLRKILKRLYYDLRPKEEPQTQDEIDAFNQAAYDYEMNTPDIECLVVKASRGEDVDVTKCMCPIHVIND